MHRIDTAGHDDGLFQDGTPQVGQQGTVLDAAWCNGVQEEICEVVEGAGIVLEKGDHTQLKAAIEAMITAAIGASRVPAGTVVYLAAAAIPAGWLECDGAVVLRADHPDLFTAIGTTHNTGGETGFQFRLPDLRGEFIRGWDHGRGVDVGRALGSAQADQLKEHQHSIPARNNGDAGDGYVEDANGTGDVRTTTTGLTGGTETRPRNVALLALIKT